MNRQTRSEGGSSERGDRTPSANDAPPSASTSGQARLITRGNRPARTLWLVLLLAFVVRASMVVSCLDQLSSDPDGYRQIAQILALTGIYGLPPEDRAPGLQSFIVRPTAFRPPLYPLLLSLCAYQGQVMPAAVAVVHVLMGLGTVALVYRLSERAVPACSPLVASLGIACDPLLLQHSTLLMTETTAALLAALSLVALDRWSGSRAAGPPIAAGFCLGVAALCRPVFLVYLLLVLLVAAVRGDAWKLDRWRTLCFALAASVPLAPWIARNHKVLAAPIVTTTHGGYTLLLANNRSLYDHLRAWRGIDDWNPDDLERRWRDLADEAGTADEVARDRLAYRVALEVIREDPGMFVRSGMARVGRLWGVLPAATSAQGLPRRGLRYAVAVWYVIVWMLVIRGLWRLGRSILAPPWVWGLVMVVALTVVHFFFWTNMRMRVPALPLIYLLAGVGAASFFPGTRRQPVTRVPVSS